MEDHNDTHQRITALENSTSRMDSRMESALSGLSENMQRMALAIERLTTYQQEHDRFSERTGQRIQEIETEVRTCQTRFNKWLNIGIGACFVAGSLFTFASSYSIDGILTLNREMHATDKRISKLEYYSGKAFLGDVGLGCEPTQPQEPVEPPKTRTAVTPQLRGG